VVLTTQTACAWTATSKRSLDFERQLRRTLHFLPIEKILALQPSIVAELTCSFFEPQSDQCNGPHLTGYFRGRSQFMQSRCKYAREAAPELHHE